MGEITAISWADHTFNPWIGCMKVSPACDGCYAEALMDKRYGRVEWGSPGHGPGTRVRTSVGNWHQPIRWNKKAAADGTRPFVFCSSLADVFDNQVPAEWRADLFDLIRKTPNLVWLLLTKRPQNIVKMSTTGNPRWLGEAWPSNAAIGTTIEDQARAINLFRLAAAARDLNPLFTFASFEPLLGPVDPTRIVVHEGAATFYNDPEIEHASILFNALLGAPSLKLPPLGWAITGGETDQGGHKARATHPEWFRSLRDQCTAAGVAFHHKQNGEWARWEPRYPADVIYLGRDAAVLTSPGIGREPMVKIGKNRSGRLLDGVEHNARPQVAA